MPTRITTAEMLKRLGDGQPIAAVCNAAGISRQAFDAWWKAETESRVPRAVGVRQAGVHSKATIERDERGIPHVLADNDDDLFFAYGYAMAQDRLFQLDYLRRKASGRLAEILGPDSLESDILVRTIGIRRIADVEWRTAPDETRRLLLSFTAGVNALVADSQERLPIEFDLLGYRPEEWSPVDCLAIEGEFRWYLTGRFPVIVIPELARRTLGDGPLYAAFMSSEAGDECILPSGSYPPRRTGAEPESAAGGNPDEGIGSNNWVLAGIRTTSGKPLLASDPHIAFSADSCWYQMHLRGGSFNVAGAGYVGMPGALFGRNEQLAWGITNNICSQRDLYQEQTDADQPGCFLYDGKWEPARQMEELIPVRGSAPVRKIVRFSRNGPIVDDVLPAVARDTGPISVKWLGASQCGWLTSVLKMNRAGSADEFREAARDWLVPTFSLVFCDTAGHVGYQCTGRLPIRNIPQRGYRPGWDPAHQWDGLIPFAGMPRLADPPRGYVATANNRTAPDDFPYPLSNTSNSGHRAVRIRQMIEEQPKLSGEDCARMQADVVSLRAKECVPPLLELLNASSDRRVRTAAGLLQTWDFRMEADQVAPALFDVFFLRWSQAVVRERFAGDFVALATDAAAGLASGLLRGDSAGWFAKGRRERAVQEAFSSMLDYLAGRFGPDMDEWKWGKVHQFQPKHMLSGRGELGTLLDDPPRPVKGNMLTVFNTGNDVELKAATGAGYRLVVDLAVSPPEIMAVDAGSQSGHPGSPHYADQTDDWITARYHRIPLDAPASPSSHLQFEPPK